MHAVSVVSGHYRLCCAVMRGWCPGFMQGQRSGTLVCSSQFVARVGALCRLVACVVLLACGGGLTFLSSVCDFSCSRSRFSIQSPSIQIHMSSGIQIYSIRSPCPTFTSLCNTLSVVWGHCRFQDSCVERCPSYGYRMPPSEFNCFNGTCVLE